jgi:hypothetical protein
MPCPRVIYLQYNLWQHSIARPFRPGKVIGDHGGDIDSFVRGTNNKAAERRPVAERSLCQKNSGAGEGIRTLDPDLGKVVLYH